jgi:small subunit ribosomal protein S5
MSKPSKRPMQKKEAKEFEEEVIEVSRVTRVVKGGRRLRFRATVVIGDKKGTVGYGIGKAAEVQQAIQKAVSKARKRLLKVPTYNGTIPHQIQVKFKSSVVFMKPASEGTGIIAGGAMRQILGLSGIKNILAKSLGSTNRINTAKATYKALALMRERKDMEMDKIKVERTEGRERGTPEVRRVSKKYAKDMAYADKKMNRPQSQPQTQVQSQEKPNTPK